MIYLRVELSGEISRLDDVGLSLPPIKKEGFRADVNSSETFFFIGGLLFI